MLVCSCKAVFESTVRRSVAAGAGTVEDIGRACGAGTDCGTCVPTLEEVLDEVMVELGIAADRSDAA